VAELIFFTGTMDCGKSTLALQTDYTHRSHGRVGRVFTSHDRAGESIVSSRLGFEVPAVEVDVDLNFWHFVVDELTQGSQIDYLVCDEAQFYAPEQCDQLARIVDELDADVYAFGLITDFRGLLFDGTKRLLEVADERVPIQVEARCWCGARATHNARLVNGRVVYEGDVVVVGDTEDAEDPLFGDAVRYELLCRRHYRDGQLG